MRRIFGGWSNALAVAAISVMVGSGVFVAALGGCEREPREPEGRDPSPPATVRPSGAPAQVTTAFEQRERTNPLARRIIVADEPAERPDTLPEGASCITAECHTSYVLANRIHQTLADGQCDSCHAPDTGGHIYPLKRQGNDLCTYCHQVSGTNLHQHPAINEPPGCLNCHRPHDGEAKFLFTRETVEELCASCHDLALQTYAHEPFAQGQCSACHFPHQSQWRSLLRGGEGSAHCLHCHQDVALHLATALTPHPPAEDDCATCHAAHTSEHNHLLHQPIYETCVSCHDKVEQEVQTVTYPHAALDDDRACSACHAPHGGAMRDLLADREDRLCLSCHDRPLASETRGQIADMRPILGEPFLHGAVAAGDCSACHRGHGASVPALLKHAYPERFYTGFAVENYALCFECHSPDMVLVERTTRLTGFRDGDLNLHYVHVHQDDKGRTCRVCHAVHGSSQPLHIAEAIPFEGSDWPLPIRFEKDEHGGSCAPGCHEPHSYSRLSGAVPDPDEADETEP